MKITAHRALASAALALLCVHCQCWWPPPTTACAADTDCPAGYRCNPAGRYCQATDATAGDRAAPDAGAADASAIDVNATDLGAIDVSAIDVSAVDIGATDLGAADAGAADASATDVGATDHSAPDTAGGELIALDRAAVDGASTDRGSIDIGVAGTDAGAWDAADANHNIVFVTASRYPVASLADPAAGSAICQETASAAGLDGTFVAWLARSNDGAASRLGAARGFVRLDGLPFADTVDDIVARRIAYPLRIDDRGVDVCIGETSYGPIVITGSDGAGAAGRNCSDWTQFDSSLQVDVGFACAGGADWTAGGGTGCDGLGRLYCFEIGHTQPLGSVAQPGRLVFLSSGPFAPADGTMTADLLCEADALLAGANGSFAALLAGVGTSAGARFDPADEPWVRPDGVRVAASDDDFFTGRWLAPINLEAGGTVRSSIPVWSGAQTAGTAGDATTTCAGWTTNTGTGQRGLAALSSGAGFGYGVVPCNSPLRVYCARK